MDTKNWEIRSKSVEQTLMPLMSQVCKICCITALYIFWFGFLVWVECSIKTVCLWCCCVIQQMVERNLLYYREKLALIPFIMFNNPMFGDKQRGRRINFNSFALLQYSEVEWATICLTYKKHHFIMVYRFYR